MPRWNEGGYGAGQYDGGLIFDTTPPPNPVLPPDLGPSVKSTGTAIKEYWDSSSLTAITSDGKLWYQVAPDQPVTPYAVLIEVSEPEVARTTGFVMFEGTYQINCMNDSLQGAQAMAALVWAAFDHAPLSLDGQLLHCLPGERRSTVGSHLGTNGNDCWITYVELEILYVK